MRRVTVTRPNRWDHRGRPCPPARLSWHDCIEAVLAPFEPTPRPIEAVFPKRRLVSPKVRAMVDFLAEEFRREPSLSDYGAAAG